MTNDVALYEAYFQKNKPYYLDRLERYRNGQKYSFNPFTFLFGLFWMLYRKMYIEAVVIILVLGVESFLEELILPEDLGRETEQLVNIISTIVLATIVGFIGNYLYLRKAHKVVEKAKAELAGSEEQVAFLRKQGGVSHLFLAIILVVIIAFFVYNSL